mmetsp:Transcript_11327/g.21550  ORF Transcript_11327/g.21550 Transcript_11327/m.21550 type:complete len:752 (-) Transcript_11327:204-2459(-)|eukprot:CAMPEP_0175094350 /NCGR_PEP_ID=MMETSP0086_2-20121207/3539_1 /TAXON_ID=136419 /ORGANISM="Unknown Unknown, Strain D1" /LENGTH=751 /DNA_ID=CAMNT_0016367453 /DNA_START=39 /DNA_END=2294 /DNA_ORIENTATION=+
MGDAANSWTEAKDPATGKTYYYNKVTKQTQWTKPAELGGAAAAAPAADDANENPAFWATGTDPKSGKTYYYNKKTKLTSWKRPACMGADDGAAAAKPAEAAKPAAAAATSATSENDVANWREATDPKSGKTYWYNKVTKKTTWKNPFSDAAKPAAASPAATPAAAAATPAAASEGKDEDQQASAQMMKLKQAYHINEVEEEKSKLDDEEEEEEHEFTFAKHRKGWFNRTFRVGNIHDEGTLLTFKKSLIKKALLKQNRDLDAEAVQAFKNVMSYMGDRKSSKSPIEHAKKMIRNLMQAPAALRDEVYMQLCKQTTNNPRDSSIIKGWELMVFCIATFPPSKHLKGFLLDYIKKTIEEMTKYIESDTNEKIRLNHQKILGLAEVCQKQLPKIVLMGQRKQVPSKQELECLMENKPIPIRVNLCNGTFKTFMVDPYTLNKEVEEMLVQKYNLTCFQPFALYEQAEANQEKILDPKDRVLDVVAAWENSPIMDDIVEKKTKSDRKTKYDQHKDANKKVVIQRWEFKSFLYKAKLVLKTANKELMADPEAVNLIYIQAVSDVVTARYPSNEKDITVLAALQLQASFGDYKRDVHGPGWLAPKIHEFIPKHLITQKGKVQDNMVKEWEVKILAKYQKIQDFTSLDAKLNYLDYVQEWTFYGATFFIVEQRQFKDYPSPLTLGINCEGVLLMHPEKKTVLENYHFTDIVTWGHSDEKFIVVVGNIVQQRKLIFKTTDGKHMNHLIHDYVKFKVKSKV